jgi:hypothetical protein
MQYENAIRSLSLYVQAMPAQNNQVGTYHYNRE